MSCAACGKANLPGGVRCVYCGVHFPPIPDFDIGAPAAPPPETVHTSAARRAMPAGALGTLGILALKGKSLLALLKAGPIFTTLWTMALSVSAYSYRFGWKLALGFVLCILLHELGHVVVNWRYKIPCSAPMFIPFFGALITVKYFPDDPQIEADCGAGGPGAGLLSALICLAAALITGAPIWYALAFLAFLINFMNLVPFGPMDGARISTAFSPGNWTFVLLSLLLIVIKAPSGPLWLLLIILFFVRLGRGGYSRYQLADPRARARIAVTYVLLCLTLAYGSALTANAAQTGLRGTTYETGASQGAEREQSAAEKRSQPELTEDERALRRTVRLVARIAIVCTWFVTAGLCLLPAYLLSRAGGGKMTADGARFSLAMAAVCVAGWVAPKLVPMRDPWSFVLASYAALGAAIAFASYRLAHATRARVPFHRLAWRCLAWSAGGALVVAYWADSLWVVAAVGLAAALFFGRRSWLAVTVLAGWAEGLGSLQRAHALRLRALAMGVEPQAATELQLQAARGWIERGEGGLALELVDAAGEGSLEWQAMRAQALLLLDRYDEALAQCERILKPPAGDALGPLRLLRARAVLAQLALFRDWPDEALAQSDAVLNALQPSAAALLRVLVASVRRNRAEALAAMERLREADEECDRARKADPRTNNQALVALIRAQAALLSGRLDEAAQRVETAERSLPDGCSVRYLRARVLAALGRRDDAGRLLRDLADSESGHWANLARSELARGAAGATAAAE